MILIKPITHFTKITPFIIAPTLALCLLTGCQTTPTTMSTHPTSQPLNPEQSQKLLVSTIKSSLYHNQDWVAEQQIFLQHNTDTLTNNAAPSRLQHIEQCQDTHDKALVAQLKADKLTSYKAVKRLTEDKKAPYKTIKHAYIDCYHTAEALPDSEKSDTKPASALENVLEKSSANEDYPEQVNTVMKVLGFKSGQIANFNNFFAKNGKLTYTGNYRPYQGKLALQVDAGFENKNLRTHYRLPLVADFKNQALYLKPDVIMPYTALYLDNKLGMSWQDKWYKFNPDPQQSLPANITANAWLTAIKDSFIALPTDQFSQATPTEINTNLLPNLAQSTQRPDQYLSNLSNNLPVIHWHQTANEQIALTQATIRRYIALVEDKLAKDSTFLGLPTSEQSRYRNIWDKQKKQLLAYSENLAKNPEVTSGHISNQTANAEIAEHDEKVIDKDLETKDAAMASNDEDNNDLDTSDTDETDSKTPKNPLLASRPQGQDWYFVMANNGLKHIYIDNGVTLFQQPAKVHTWVTFNPDTRTLANANQPQTLDRLASTLRPEVIIDGRAEMKRLAGLDDSRRLFGQEPAVVKYYKDYMKKAKEQAKKDKDNEK